MGELVKYHNKLNQIPFEGFGATNLNFFYTICAKVRDKGENEVVIDFQELKRLSDYKRHNADFIKDLEDTSAKLFKCIGRTEDEKEIKQFVMFTEFLIDKENENLKIKVNPDYAWMLNNLAKEFTSFELHQYISMVSTYTKALFRLCKQWKSQGRTPKYPIDELRELLGVPDTYKPKRIMEHIINPAIEEMKSKKVWSNLWCEVVYSAKRGRPIDGYIFHFSNDSIPGQMTIDNYIDTADKKKKQSAKGTRTKPKNSFHNFEQRTYDYDELEKLLLGHSK
jgi:plasmid replication initiation protein